MYRWAYPSDPRYPKGLFDWPTIAELEAEGWHIAGQDPRYGAVLMSIRVK
jgi:hypothetical protein